MTAKKKQNKPSPPKKKNPTKKQVKYKLISVKTVKKLLRGRKAYFRQTSVYSQYHVKGIHAIIDRSRQERDLAGFSNS